MSCVDMSPTEASSHIDLSNTIMSAVPRSHRREPSSEVTTAVSRGRLSRAYRSISYI